MARDPNYYNSIGQADIGPQVPSMAAQFDMMQRLAQSQAPRRQTVPLVPPRLKERMGFYKVPMPSFAPTFDRCLVYPLSLALRGGAGVTETTAGGIVIPEQTRERFSAHQGLLLRAGVKAVEQLYSHGIGLGDIVLVTRFAPWQRAYFAEGKEHSVYIVRASDIAGSDDLATAFDKGDFFMEMDPVSGIVELTDREERRERHDPEDIDDQG